MNESLGAMCDDVYVNSRLFVKLPLPTNRETLLGFFDRLRKAFPSLTKLRRGDDGTLTLEEDRPEGGSRRWIRLEETSLRFGYFGGVRTKSIHSREMSCSPFHSPPRRYRRPKRARSRAFV